MSKLDKDQETYFAQFQSEHIDNEQLDDAEQKAENLGETKNDFLTMISLVKDVLAGVFRITTSELVVIIGAIIYVISPIDAIPDLIPVVGWMDDIAIVGFVMYKLHALFERYKEWRNIDENP